MRRLHAIILLPLLTPAAVAKVRPAVDRIDAIVGQPLVLPLAADDHKELADFPLALDDAQRPGLDLFHLRSAGLTEPGWLGPIPRWRAIPSRDALRESPLPPGVWYAVIDLPLDAVSQGLWIDSERYEINWLPDPERAALESGGRRLWESPVPPEAADSPALADALATLAADPFQSWRARLARDGLTPTGGIDRTGSTGTDLAAVREDLDTPDEQRFLAALARHHEARWQLILGRLALIDPDTAARMRRALAGVARIDAQWLPIWTPDGPELRILQADLLSPWVDDETRVLRAQAWLDTQPRALAWVVDDAGDPDAGESRIEPTVSVLSLPAAPAPLLTELPGSMGAPALQTVAPFRAARVRASIPLLEDRGHSATIRTASIPVRVGRTDTTAEALATIPGVRPPGLRLGPLLEQWTAPALLAGSPDFGAVPTLDTVATGILRKRAQPGRGSAAEGWSVYVRCLGPSEQADTVTVWTGPFGLPRQVWQIGRDGSVVHLFGARDLIRITVAEVEGGWAFDAELPAESVDEDDVLRIGLVRQVGDRRTSWPRRMTPGQDEPGRIGVDVTAWDGF